MYIYASRGCVPCAWAVIHDICPGAEGGVYFFAVFCAGDGAARSGRRSGRERDTHTHRQAAQAAQTGELGDGGILRCRQPGVHIAQVQGRGGECIVSRRQGGACVRACGCAVREWPVSIVCQRGGSVLGEIGMAPDNALRYCKVMYLRLRSVYCSFTIFHWCMHSRRVH